MKRWLPTVLLAALLGILAIFTTMVFAQQEQSGTRKVISRSSPIYPDLARRMQMSGTVRVEVVVAPSGTVKSTKAVGGSPLLLKAATDAIAKWKWSSSPQESTELIELNFRP
jgi:TonB family protein